MTAAPDACKRRTGLSGLVGHARTFKRWRSMGPRLTNVMCKQGNPSRPSIRAVLIAAAALVASPTLAPGATPTPTQGAASNDPPREMIAALPALGPHRSLGDQARLFDRFVGTWDFECLLYAADGSVTRFPGEWIFGWVLDGRAMQDVWIGYLKSRMPGERGVGTSVRFYDATSGLWRVVWVAPMSGNVLTLKGVRKARA